MNTFLCLAITFLLAGLLFIYVRSQMTVLESKVSTLTGLVRDLAEPPHVQQPETCEKEKVMQETPTLARCYVSDDSDSDSESDNEHEKDGKKKEKKEERFEKVKEAKEELELKELFEMKEESDVNMQVRVIPMRMNMASMMQQMMQQHTPIDFETGKMIDFDNIQKIDLDDLNREVEVVELPNNLEPFTGQVEIVEVSNAVDSSKVAEASVNLEALSVKELKEIAMSRGAPSSLKTKKALLEFLQS